MKPFPRKFCAIFPSAGYGKRLGANTPKIFLQVDGEKTIFEVLLTQVMPGVRDCVVVLSPQGADYIKELSKMTQRMLRSHAVAIQETPKGTADAVFCAFQYWTLFENILVIWGDQALVARETIQKALKLHHTMHSPHLTFPVVQVPDPYIHYEINPSKKKILSVQMRREADQMPEIGVSDVGIFVLSVRGLSDGWKKFQQENVTGNETKELNFPSFFAFLSTQLNWPVLSFEIKDPNQCRGINTKEDLNFVREFYSHRKAG